MKKLLILVAFVGFWQMSISQVITTGATIQDYIENVLIGNGVAVSNITINYTDPNVIGEFTGFAGTNLGLDHGLVISCGTVIGVNSAVSNFNSESLTPDNTDADLAAITPNVLHDAVVIEFDFVPQSDHIEFRYIFGSEEFPEFVNSGYNDAFGFFLTSNTSDGYNYVAENIALIPGTITPVTIDNIFPTTYYVDNEGSGGQDIIYDGFTQVLTAEADVMPCVSYHIKLAIGDAGDQIYDSGFFLDAFSFSTNAPSIDLDFSQIVNDSTNAIIEGCTSVDIIFEVDEAFAETDTFHFASIGGTAINGIDYTYIDSFIVFQAGDTLAWVTINPLMDALVEGSETIEIIIQTTPCGQDTIVFTILNDVAVIADFDITTELCEGATNIITFTGVADAEDTLTWNFDGGTIINGDPNGLGFGPFEIEWDTYGLKNISVVIDAAYGCSSDYHSVAVTVKQMPTCDFTISENICHNGTATICYTNNNTPQIPCSGNLIWAFNSNITTTVLDPCCFTVTAENTTGSDVAYPLSLQVDLDGCISDICIDSLIVYPEGQVGCCTDPIAYAGPDTSLCILEHVLGATIGSGANHGQWIYLSGPNVTFLPATDQGTAILSGNPGAHIMVDNPGTLQLIWKEWSNDCNDQDTVEVTFYQQPNVTIGQPDGYSVCGLSTTVEAISSVVPGTTFEWLNPCAPTTNITFPNSDFNPTMGSTDYICCDFKVVGTVGSQCRDTAVVPVCFVEMPICDAGPDNAPCGTLDTLHAVSTFGGYWTVDTYNGTGTNCSAVFTNHLTGEPDIYDPNAVISVTCEGEWILIWHEVNGQCESTCNVSINFSPNTINITTLPEQKTCYRYAQVHVDTIGYGDDTWLWAVDPNWPYINTIPVSFNPYDPMTIVYKSFPESVFGDSGQVTIPMIVTLITGGCASTETSSVTFYQSPTPNLGNDTLVCNNEIDFNVNPTVPTSVSSVQWYDLGNGGSYLATPDDAYVSTISANYGDSLYIVFSEENTLGENGLGCTVYDSILVEFLIRPNPDAGDDEYHNCGNCIQLESSLDNAVNSIGRWLINSEGHFGYSCGDNNSAAVSDTNAWFYHSTDINPGVDTVYVQWMEYNAKSAQCFAVDSVPVYFWYQDSAYIKLNGNVSLMDSTCGRDYVNISANDSMPTNSYSRGTWWSVDGNPIEWYKDGSAGAHNEPQLDFIRVSSINQQSSVTRDIYWIIENGDIYGSDPAVCVDTSMTITIRFDNPVISNILESYSYPEPLVNCGDTLPLTAGDIYDWTHFNWLPHDLANPTYTFFQNGYTGNRADTLTEPVLVAPGNIYPNSDTLTGGNTHETIYLLAHNGMCIDIDTINVTWAPIPTGIFTIERPRCAGTEAELVVNRDYVTGFDKFITDIEWFFEEDDEPTTEQYSSTRDTAHLWWANSADNEDYAHAVSVKTTNIWGCEYRIFPPDTVFEPLPAYVEWIDDEYPICGECDGELSFRNYSDASATPIQYSINWATNPEFNNATDLILQPSDTVQLEELCVSEYYVLVTYQSHAGGSCNDTLYFNLHADSSTVAGSSFEFLVDTTDLQAPFELSNTTINNTSANANKYTWQVFNGTEEDLAMLIWEGNEEIPDYIFTNMGEYLIKLQSFNDKAPNCPAEPMDVTIFVHYESVLEVPNIFTPNGDGFNDEFRVKARELETYKCVVYNRWGEKVFETEDPTESWNGKKMNEGGDLSSGSYYYVITGTGKKGEPFEFKGALQLMKDNK